MTRRVFLFRLACLAAMLGAWVPAHAAGGAMAVLYPDIGEPYRSVFTRMVDGIEERTRSPVPSYAVSSRTDLQDLAKTLRKDDVRVVVALGKHGLRAAESLGSVSVVGGGVISVSPQEAANSTILTLAPDPAMLFARLRSLTPWVRRVFAVYDPQQNAWLMNHARDAAKAAGLELVLAEAPDLRSALRQYQDILARADGKQDALWLPQDSTTVEDASVLSLVIQECWDRSITLFSSSVAHVKRGALFALYPDNVQLGHSLAQAAQAQLNGSAAPRGMVPLRDVLMALNTRTASHLGLNLSLRQQQSIDLLFPEP